MKKMTAKEPMPPTSPLIAINIKKLSGPRSKKTETKLYPGSSQKSTTKASEWG